MMTMLKVLWSVGLDVLKALLPFLLSATAKFYSQVKPEAIKIVTDLAARTDLKPTEKAAQAAKQILEVAKQKGIESHASWINAALEIAWTTVQADIEKKLAATTPAVAPAAQPTTPA